MASDGYFVEKHGLLAKKDSKTKYIPANAGDTRDMGLIPGFGRPPGEGNRNPLQQILP